MGRNGVLFQPDPIPFPNDHKDYSDHEERHRRTIIDKIVHSKHERAYDQKEDNEQCKLCPELPQRLTHTWELAVIGIADFTQPQRAKKKILTCYWSSESC